MKFLPLLIALSATAIVAAGCVTKRGTYPIEVYPEQHYSQAYRYQEQPRVPPAADAVVYVPVGTDRSVAVPTRDERPYDPQVAAELFRVNCSACHGSQGLGNGPIVPFLTAPDSYYATTDPVTQQPYAAPLPPYAAPPNLQESRLTKDEDTIFSIITSGVVVMPKFGLLLSEEDRWEIVHYIFDTQNGLGK